MSKHAKSRYTNKTALRTRAAVMAVGLGASLALGAGTATAADALVLTDLAPGLDEALTVQADAQRKADEAEKKAAEERAHSWVSPVDSYVLGSTFGIAGGMWAHNHSGQDFVVGTGTPVKAAHGGVVVKAGGNGGGDGPAYGNAIVIKHDNHTYTQYAHLSQVRVQPGQNVATGQQIGLSGSTGNSTGPHLHFEVRTGPDYGSGIEPVGFLRAHGDKV